MRNLMICTPHQILFRFQSIRMRWVGHVALMRREEVYTVFWWRNLRERSFGRPRHRWEDNSKMEFQEVGWGREWIDLAGDRDRWWALINVVKNIPFHKMRAVS